MLKVFLNALCWCQESKKHFKTWWFFVKWFLQYHDKIMTHNDQMMQTIFSKDILYDIKCYYWTQSKSWWLGRTDLLQFQLPAVNISKHFTTKQFSIKCRTQGIYQTWKWRRGKKWTFNVSLWWMTVNYFSAMPILLEIRRGENPRSQNRPSKTRRGCDLGLSRVLFPINIMSS